MRRLTLEIQERGLKKIQVSAATGIYPADLRKLEMGQVALWPSWGKKLEAFFGVPASDLMKEVGK